MSMPEPDVVVGQQTPVSAVSESEWEHAEAECPACRGDFLVRSGLSMLFRVSGGPWAAWFVIVCPHCGQVQ
jgi:hypothetical protein